MGCQIKITSFLSEAYNFLTGAFETINISEAEFETEIDKAPTLFNIYEKARNTHNKNQVISMGQFGGWQELRSLIKESQQLLDPKALTEYRRGQNMHQLEVVTSKYHIWIRRDMLEHLDFYLIKTRP